MTTVCGFVVWLEKRKMAVVPRAALLGFMMMALSVTVTLIDTIAGAFVVWG